MSAGTQAQDTLPMPGVSGHGAILRALGRSLRGSWWLVVPPIVVFALGLLRSPTAAFTGAAVAWAILFQFAWWSIASGLMMQNHPLTARLVPGQVRQLREVALGLFVLISVLSGALMSAFFGDVLAWMPAFAAAMLVFGMALRWPMLWFFVWIVPSVAFSMIKDTTAWRMLVAAMVDWHVHQPMTQTAVLMLALCALLWRVFQEGGDGHLRSWEANRRMRQRLVNGEGGRQPMALTGSLGEAFGRCFNWGQPVWREQLLRSARPTASSVAARAEIAVLRGLHWSALGGLLAIIFTGLVLAGLAVRLWLGDARSAQFLAGALPGVSFGVMCSMIGPAMGIASMQHRTRREQALMLLVPGMPRGDALNRTVGPRLLGNFVIAWGLGVAAMAVLALLVPDGGPADVPIMGVHVAAVTLPFGLLLWQDWSSKGVPTSSHATLGILVVMVLVGLSLVLCALTGWSPWTVLAGSVVMTAGLTAWRWRGMRRLAPFWPVGRNA